MLEKVNLNQIQHIQGEVSRTQAESKKACEKTGNCVSNIDFDGLVAQAQSSVNDNTEAVAKAKELLNSGQLDSKENILKAAENIIKYGI